MSKDTPLQINYEEFFAVLKEWEDYTFVRLKELSKNMPTSFEDDYSSIHYGGHCSFADAKIIVLSDLSDLLWKSLEAGSKEVERIHDEYFSDKQVNYFKDKFCNAEKIVNSYDSSRMEYNYYYSEYEYGKFDSENPMSIFVKLGKPAQLQIIQEDFLQIAIKHSEEAKRFIDEREYARNYVSEEEREERDKKWKEDKRIAKVKREVMRLDNWQCVFCNKILDTTARRNYFSESDEFITERVFLSCYSCLQQNNEEITPRFGRFANK